MQTIQTQDIKSQLEKILGEVRKDFVPSRIPRLYPPSKHAVYGLCGFAARRVVQKLLAADFPIKKVKVYTFWCHNDPYHTLAALVTGQKTKFSFDETWRIDPVVEEKNTKHLYAPGESYWLEDIPEINTDLYFFRENKSCDKLRLTDDKLKFIYDHVKDPPSYIVWQTAVSRSTVTGYRHILKTLELMLSNNPAKEKDIIKKFGKCYHNSVRTWLDFLVQKGVYKVEGEEDKIYRKIAEVRNAG
jgi:hypothetical protein